MKPKSCAPKPGLHDRARRERRRSAFNLTEVVIATAIISFALLALLGVMGTALVTHREAGDDSVLTLMTESALQEMRNIGYNSINTSTTYYIYFDFNGQITADGNSTTGSSGGDYEQSTAVSPTTNSIPASAALTSGFPAGTVYQCAITASTVTPYQSVGGLSTSGSMYSLTLTFTWPVGATASAQKTRYVNASISNPNYVP